MNARRDAMSSVRLGLHGFFALLYVLATVGTIITGELTPVVAILAGLTGAWYVYGIWLGSRYEDGSGRRQGSWRGSAWLAVLVLLWMSTTLVERAYVWICFCLFLLDLLLLPVALGILSVVLTTAFVIYTEFTTHDVGDPVAGVGGPILGAVISIGVAWGYNLIVRESRERARLISELTLARDDLVELQDVLVRTQREAGALGERARLARDIHDTLAQGFSSILLLARAGQARCQGPERVLLEQIVLTANENLDEARRVVHALAPADLAEAPLSSAISRQLQRLGTQTGIQTELVVDGESHAVPTGVEVELLRIAQGALANVRRHAQAQRVKITLTYEPDEVRLDVVDDGRGFDTERVGRRPDGSGFGLRSLQERVAVLDGSLSIESAPGDGTAVVATIPLKRIALEAS